ncbi:TIM-barrel domain-containing protein [Clostridium fallax]|uniref:Alpha-glucosidase n=1 Tax=Clostridium fallax TaxID=1533 RepID=A0A1M4XAJ7_9CLOT|nr:TIM-barrel domain-containing protein [Clostridium fallax]SHE90558.1 alpha-glucosidase [Clostridium fallax]SQB06004.1 alpha-glucosidase [Clostridium fallax]
MRVYEINDHIKKYSFGEVFQTDTVVIKGKEIKEQPLEFLKKTLNNQFLYILDDEDIVYGLGENVRGINKRGWIYESFCTDEFSHLPNKKSLYGAHNFLIVYGKETFGIFLDYPGRAIFDVDYSKRNELKITTEDDNLDIYIIKGKNLNNIVQNFRNLIGESYVPPKWAFGYQQCRWSYKNEEEVEEVLDNFKANNIPIDCIYLDIDYMEDFKDFTVNKKNFPNFKSFIEKMKKKGVRLIPIIDAGVKIEEGYDVYEEGIKNKYFCVDENNNPFVAAVWPGVVHFPDFLNKDARLWFGKKYKYLIDQGIEGFWNDMNEPAIFYSKKGLEKAFKKIEEAKGKNLGIYDFFDIKDTFPRLANSMEDYRSFYHNVDGTLVRHDKVHNLYGYNMTRAASEGFDYIDDNKRFLLFSRASMIGMHRYGGIWTGDNTSSFEHLELNMKMMPSLNMCGFMYIGADTAGFGDNTTDDLAIRWSQFSIFTPLFRNHSALGTRRQEPYAFDGKATEIIKNSIEIRYALIPYIYSEFMKATINNDMYFKPMTFEYNDSFVNRIEDQLIVGDSIMIAPIYKQNAKGRYIYLPEEMLLWKAKKYHSEEFEIINKGHSYIDVAIDEIPIFIRKDKILVLEKPAENIDSMKNNEINIVAFLDKESEYKLYDDDGKSKDYKKGKYNEINIKVINKNNDIEVKIDVKGNTSINKINVTAITLDGKRILKEVILN